MTIDITEHVPFVRWVVDRYYGRFVNGRIEREDLISAGYEGLIRAGEKFDPARGFAFTTYALGWVRSFIHRYIQANARLVRVPVYLQDGERGKQLRPERLTWLDAPYGHDAERTNHEFMGSDDRAQPQALTAEDTGRLLSCIKNERVRYVVTQVYLKERTLDQAGELLGVSRERVRQLVLQGLAEMRHALKRRCVERGAGSRQRLTTGDARSPTSS